jgi:two-component system, NtrC family, sensor kinase
MRRRGGKAKAGKPRRRPKSRTKAGKAASARTSVAKLDERLRQRTRELEEALQQQTATSEVLSIIRRSPADAQPVFEAIVQSATRLCDGVFSVFYLYSNDRLRIAALKNFTPEATSQIYGREKLRYLNRSFVGGRAILDRAVALIPDVLEDAEYSREFALAGGWRAVLAVPLLRDGQAIGALTVGKAEPNSFSERQIQLLKTFADQAVIAIENVRLFDEVRTHARDLSESLQQQTATADVLKVISRSTFDLRVVLQTLVESAARLSEADKTQILRPSESEHGFYPAASYGYTQEYNDYLSKLTFPPSREGVVGRVQLERKPVQIVDVLADPDYALLETQRLGGFRTHLGVPLLREGNPIGVLVVSRVTVKPFTEKQIELLTTFADQAVIAIENVRLFESVQTRTRELAESLEHLRTTQDRLVQTQKIASLGQLTAGIAHEMKNPLNFVNNFSTLSAELVDELNDTLKGLPFSNDARAQLNELTETLHENLEKVVHHGRRADAIVKNMLLHSRESSSEHRRVDINGIVEESLKLAWHGARAEKQGFEIAIERSLDPTAGEVDMFPQDVTRALLNVIANGFYAASKRKTEAGSGAYEPKLAASTRSLGDRVEVRIRDNGTGMPPDVKEKMFDPFFTTKPAGEGTGLGLSISHDIIVKQHAGAIEVETRPGEFTEVRVILPRSALFV